MGQEGDQFGREGLTGVPAETGVVGVELGENSPARTPAIPVSVIDSHNHAEQERRYRPATGTPLSVSHFKATGPIATALGLHDGRVERERDEGRALLRRLVKSVREQRADLPGLVDQVDDYLRRTHDPNAVLR